jgi:hypothetical protein
MSTAPTDYEHLLRAAINQARAKAPSAIDDLLQFSSNAAVAVAEVTGGAAALELVPVNQGETGSPTYQLQLRKVGSDAPPSDLGVYSVTATGYPVHRWHSRRAWESRPESPNDQFLSASALEGNFRWMVSDPDSRLVILVTFFQQQAPPSPEPGSGTGVRKYPWGPPG